MEDIKAETRVIASPENWIEGAAVQQLERTARLPGMRFAVGLPDLQPGKDSPIGAAFGVEGLFYPTLVGNDIGCGVGLWRTRLSARKIRRDDWADRLRGLDDGWDGDAGAFLADHGLEPTGFENSLGTIGGGNHFAELQAVEELTNPALAGEADLDRSAVYLCVHSGSRGFGDSILRKHTEAFGLKGLPFDSAEGAKYLALHRQAVGWAFANRKLVARRVSDCLKTESECVLDICHNSVESIVANGRQCWVHRKGAAPATVDLVAIPGSRGAFTYLVKPREATEHSGYSLAHGAGRKWSRTNSRARLEKRYTAKELTRTDLGSHVICEDKQLLYEEAPQAYKNTSMVIRDLVQAGLAEVVAILRPLVTYKVRR